MRNGTLLAAAAAAIVWGSVPAHAGLIGTGTNTVDAQFYLGTHDFAGLEDEGTQTIVDPTGAHYADGAVDLSRIDVGDTQITITNDSTFPYCFTLLPCSDTFTGFEFIFSSGVDISGVSVDGGTAAGMIPVSLSLVTPRDILVDMTGLAPNLDDQLILDLTFPGTTPPVPEPSSLVILGTGLVGLLAARKRAIRTKKAS